MKWERNPEVWLARCCTGVLSSSFAIALGDSKSSLASSDVQVCFFFFFLLCSCTREWKNNAGLRCYNQGLAEWDVSGKQYSATKKLKTTDMISSHLIPHTYIPTVKSVFLNIPLIDTVISKWETFLAFE